MEDKKRKRSANYTQEEINVLVHLVSENKSTIENKTTGGATWKEKVSVIFFMHIELLYYCITIFICMWPMLMF